MKKVKYIVEGDENDGDYISNAFDLTGYCNTKWLSLEFMEGKINEFIEIISSYEPDDSFDRCNWASYWSDWSITDVHPRLWEDWNLYPEWAFIEDMLPSTEDGIHTIVSITKIVWDEDILFQHKH